MTIAVTMIVAHKHLRLLALASALIHLADSPVTGLSHRHFAAEPASCGSPVACCHHHSPICPPREQPPNCPGDKDCFACRHLCQPLWQVPETVSIDRSDSVATFDCRVEVQCSRSRFAAFQSRAPPA